MPFCCQHTYANTDILSFKQQKKTLTFLNRRLDLKASKIDASLLSTTNFPLSLLHSVPREFDIPTNFSCSRIREIMRQTFVCVAERSKNLSRYGMCSASIALIQDNPIVMTFKVENQA